MLQQLLVFLSKRRLHELNPDMIVFVPTFGYPQIAGQIAMINAGWDSSGQSSGLVDSIGIMVYSGTESLDWVDEYTESGQQGADWPITADVPESAVLVGCKVPSH